MGVISDLVESAEDVKQSYINAVDLEYQATMEAGKMVAPPIASFGSDVVTARKPPDRVIETYQRRGFDYLDTYDVSSVCGLAAFTGLSISLVGAAIPTAGTSEILLPAVEGTSTLICDVAVNVIESISPERGLNCSNIVVAVFVNWNEERADLLPFCESWFK